MEISRDAFFKEMLNIPSFKILNYKSFKAI